MLRYNGCLCIVLWYFECTKFGWWLGIEMATEQLTGRKIQLSRLEPMVSSEVFKSKFFPNARNVGIYLLGQNHYIQRPITSRQRLNLQHIKTHGLSSLQFAITFNRISGNIPINLGIAPAFWYYLKKTIRAGKSFTLFKRPWD